MAFQGNIPCNAFKIAQWNGAVNFATAAFYIAFYTNAAALSSSTPAYTSSGEVVASGYPAGGVPLTTVLQPTASGETVIVDFADVTVNAAFTARGALVYMHGGANTAAFILDFGADKTSTTAFTVQFPVPTAAAAIIRVT